MNFFVEVGWNTFGLVFDPAWNIEIKPCYIKMFSITYSTLNLKGDNTLFYNDLARTTDEIIFEASTLLSGYVDLYRQFIKGREIENLRAENEYLLELIMLGVLWRSKETHVSRTSLFAAKTLKWLYEVRKNSTTFKPLADRIRGLLVSVLLFRQSEQPLSKDIRSFRRLLMWLDATGEYSEETKRLKVWLEFAKSMKENDFRCFIERVYGISESFRMKCAKSLGSYTINVERFVSKAKYSYKGREDYALANRREVEYHLNMVGAEMLNRELRSDFIKAKQKIVLLPTCMRLDANYQCKAIGNNFERKCIGCDSKCNVGKVFKSLSPYNIDIYLIPHSSDFSKFLQRWKDNSNVALVGVACVLNLLMGGYEMIGLNIASQCIYLDYCGCKKHWDAKGVATSINIPQLHRILDLSNSKEGIVGKEN